MPSPGETRMASPPPTVAPPHSGAEWLDKARERERAGALADAIECYEAAIEAEQTGAQPVLAEALRRLAILRYHKGELERARELCRWSYEVGRQIGNDTLAAEALN